MKERVVLEKKYCESSLVRPVGQAVKTRPFHGCNGGSIPPRVILARRCSQVVRQRSATPLRIGSNPISALDESLDFTILVELRLFYCVIN